MSQTPVSNRPVRADWLAALTQRAGREATAGEQPKLAQLQGAAEQFEAIFVKQMLQTMRKSALAEAPQGMGALAYDFMDDAVSKATTESGAGFGIARSVFLSTAEPLLRATRPAEAAPRPDKQKHA